MKTLSLDLRERVVAAYDEGDETREDVADRFGVSLGMVKKLLRQRKETGNLRPRHRFSGRKPLIVEAHRRQMRQFLGKQPDMTLSELRGALGLSCTLPAIHYALARMNLTYKKRHCAPASNNGLR